MPNIDSTYINHPNYTSLAELVVTNTITEESDKTVHETSRNCNHNPNHAFANLSIASVYKYRFYIPLIELFVKDIIAEEPDKIAHEISRNCTTLQIVPFGDQSIVSHST
jgi:hypothetical protein